MFLVYLMRRPPYMKIGMPFIKEVAAIVIKLGYLFLKGAAAP
jgi:hypothetical protein